MMLSQKKYDLVVAVKTEKAWIEVKVPRGAGNRDDKTEALKLIQQVLSR